MNIYLQFLLLKVLTMLAFSKLSKKTSLFKQITGVSPEQCQQIVGTLRPFWDEAERKRLARPDRQRAIGAGAKYHIATLADKVMVLLIYYRTYITMDFLGLLFDLDKSSISRLVGRLETAMKKSATLPGDKPKKPSRRKKISTMEEFLKEYPEMRDLIIDVTEHPIGRPKRRQKEYYSGKKKGHKIKSQITINTDGGIVDVEGGKPGARHDKKIFDESEIKAILPRDMEMWVDLGYQGIREDFPNAEIPYKKKRGGPILNKIQKRLNRAKARVRIFVEHVIGRLKIFHILSDRYRGNLQKHEDIVRTISYITNLKYGFAR